MGSTGAIRAGARLISPPCALVLRGFQDCFRTSQPPADLLGSRTCSNSASDSNDTASPASTVTSAEAPSTDGAPQEQTFRMAFEDPKGFDEDFFPVQILREPYGMQGNKRVTRAEKIAGKLALKGVDRRLQYHSIPVPPDVTVHAMGTRLYFTGPLGSNALDVAKIDDQGLGAFKLERAENGRITEIQLAGPSKSIVGTARTLLHNKINGVARGYLVYLQLSGVGFRVSKENKEVKFPVSR